MAGKKLLVADDSATIQKVIRLALAASAVPGRDRHYEIQSVSDGNDLIRHLGHVIPDAILIDVSLPHKSAFEVKTAVEKMGPKYAHIRFVLLVGSDERIEDSRLRELGFSGVLTKPFEPSHLRQVLADALESAPEKTTEDGSDLPPPAPSEDQMEASAGSDLERESTEIELELLPPPPLDSEQDHDSPPPALPIPEDEPPALPDAFGERSEENDLWNNEEEQLLQNATRNIQIRLHAPEPGGANDTENATRASKPAPRPNLVEEDIRKLAETTMRLSGIEDSMTSGSPLEPTPIFPEKEMVQPPRIDDETGWAVREPARLPAGTPKLPPPPLSHELGKVTFPSETLGLGTIRPEQRLQSSEAPPGANPQAAPPTHPIDEPSIVPLSMDQMEQILERQLRSTLQSMAEKMLPEIATKILKDEIHKMLTTEGP